MFTIELSQDLEISGLIIKYAKYRDVNVCPMMINGSSTGRPPIHVRMAQDATSNQNMN